MKKPPDSYLPPLQLAAPNLLTRTSSSPSEAFPGFLSSPFNFSETNHHHLATCKDFPLLERIWKRYWSWPINSEWMMKINNELLLLGADLAILGLYPYRRPPSLRSRLGCFSQICGDI